MSLDGRQTLVLAIIVLYAGKFLNRRIGFLRRFNIPEPVTGGVLASVVSGALYFAAGIEVEFALASRDLLLLVFFTTIGLSARLADLARGGRSLFVLAICAGVYLVLQNLTGVGIAAASGLPARLGLLGGSVSLSGGHGTAIAWAPLFAAEYGIDNAMEIGVACATFGLVVGGIIGGPVAQFLVARHGLHPGPAAEPPTVGIAHDAASVPIDADMMLKVIFVIAVAIGIGIQLNVGIAAVGLKLPDFVTCLFAGILLTNLIPWLLPRLPWREGASGIALVSDVSLGLFLAMSLMSLQLWTLADLAGSIFLILGGQVVVILAFVIFGLFPLMGRDYDAAVICAGYAGLGLGATPTAIANMTAVTKKFGASPRAFIVVPMVGAFFVDMMNAVVIQFFLRIFS